MKSFVELGRDIRLNEKRAAGGFPGLESIALDNGQFVVAWGEQASDDVVVRRFDGDGDATTREYQRGAGVQSFDLAPLTGKTYVLVTNTVGQAGTTTVSGRIANYPGGDVAFVATHSAEASGSVAVTALSDGRFVVFWKEAADAHAQFYKSDGKADGAALDLGVAFDGAHVSATPDGGFVLSRTVDDGSFYEAIRATRFDLHGNKVGSSVDLTPFSENGPGAASLAVLADNSYVAVWEHRGTDGSDPNLDYLEARIVSADGLAGEAFQIGAKGDFQDGVVTAALAGGGFAVAWLERTGDRVPEDQQGSRICVQVYDDSGHTVGNRITASDDFEADNYAPAIAALTDGSFVVSWEELTDGTVAAQRFVYDAHKTESGTRGDDILAGLVGNDTLHGLDGDDHLDGGNGADRMEGGRGDDVFVVENAGDTVVELEGGGLDTVRASISYRMTANVETLTLTGRQAIGGTGTNSNDLINGNDAANYLVGRGGRDILCGMGGDDVLEGATARDILDGGKGQDTLTGGSGNDTFAFTVKPNQSNADHITDFDHNDDHVSLDHRAFVGLAAGVLGSSAFRVGLYAVDADDRLIYDRNTGQLWFDSDGSGTKDPHLIATLDNHAKLTATDFVIV